MALPGQVDDTIDAPARNAFAAVAHRIAAGHADAGGAVVALGAARHAQTAVARPSAAAVGAASIGRRAATRQADAGPAILAVRTTGGTSADAILLACTAGVIAAPCLRRTRLAAAVLASVAVLTLLPKHALIALTAEHGRDAGDALAVEAAQSGLAVAGGLALLAAAIQPPVAVLALLPDWAAVGLAAEHRREAGDAASVVAHQAWRTVAGCPAMFAELGHAHLGSAVAAGRATRHARAAVPRWTLGRGIGLLLAGRDRCRADEIRLCRLRRPYCRHESNHRYDQSERETHDFHDLLAAARISRLPPCPSQYRRDR